MVMFIDKRLAEIEDMLPDLIIHIFIEIMDDTLEALRAGGCHG
jgi:hypothetical protein